MYSRRILFTLLFLSKFKKLYFVDWIIRMIKKPVNNLQNLGNKKNILKIIRINHVIVTCLS